MLSQSINQFVVMFSSLFVDGRNSWWLSLIPNFLLWLVWAVCGSGRASHRNCSEASKMWPYCNEWLCLSPQIGECMTHLLPVQFWAVCAVEKICIFILVCNLMWLMRWVLLPHVTCIAQCMLWLGVYLCLKLMFCPHDWVDQGYPWLPIHCVCYKRIWISPEIRVLPSGALSRALNNRCFAFHHGTLTVANIVDLVPP